MDSAAELFSLTPGQLRDFFLSFGESPFRGEQLFRWLHKVGATSYSQMTDISRELRERLEMELPFHTPLSAAEHALSKDGSVKIASITTSGLPVETVIIPGTGQDRRKYTLCVSTQVGCALGCAFCETATMGFLQNLSSGEIVYQVSLALSFLEKHLGEKWSEHPREQWITNIVYMGMGEPFLNLENVIHSIDILTHTRGLNLSHRRITISTSGIFEGFERLAEETDLKVNLAVSLNSPVESVRRELMPISRRYPISGLVKAIAKFPLPRRQRITIEYIMFDGINDTLDDAGKLAALLRGLSVKINLIPYNKGSVEKSAGGRPLRASSRNTIDRFATFLRSKGFAVTVRASSGQDIAAACGQLARKTRRSSKDASPGEKQ
ncbi:23S rRNA (adenine(2503)-C(2))-methyltransferase RlmN [Myxococcota bacterium]|nr:23S rRNA (adenine(2503)-C(2))-methyltransferase RlmN [Myxococcota bacterium]